MNDNSASKCVRVMAMSDGQSCCSGSTPEPIDIETPEGSYTEGPDLTDSQRQTISECEAFAESFNNICSNQRRHGHTEKSIPPFPKSELLELMGVRKQPKVLMGYELHNYLLNKICSDIPKTPESDIPTPEIYGISQTTTLDKCNPGCKTTTESCRNNRQDLLV